MKLSYEEQERKAYLNADTFTSNLLQDVLEFKGKPNEWSLDDALELIELEELRGERLYKKMLDIRDELEQSRKLVDDLNKLKDLPESVIELLDKLVNY